MISIEVILGSLNGQATKSKSRIFFFEGREEEALVDGGTPQKSLNRKKLKGTDGEAVTKKSDITSATSEQGDRRKQ